MRDPHYILDFGHQKNGEERGKKKKRKSEKKERKEKGCPDHMFGQELGDRRQERLWVWGSNNGFRI